ncbi:MAG: circularly permuted type 2 ATP-grasp protein, partial [Desulfobacterales bacterium]
MATFETYDPGDYYDELIAADGHPRPGAQLLVDKIMSLPPGELALRQKAAEALLLKMGITFNVYGRDEGTEKIFPFDIIPRIVSGSDWQQIENGLKQRIFALNAFIQDIYNQKKILKDKVVPEDLILTSRTYRKECEGFTPPRGVWCHVTGTDLVRDRDGRFYVLEDNLRCPSGVSYVLENRQVLKRTFPQVFEASRVRPVDDYPTKLLETLTNLAPEHVQSPTIGVLTPGIYNSAYFEHSFLSQQMGVEL